MNDVHFLVEFDELCCCALEYKRREAEISGIHAIMTTLVVQSKLSMPGE